MVGHKYNITSVSSLDEAEAYMDAIAKNEPGMIPLDVGSDYDKLFVFDRMWKQACRQDGAVADEVHGQGDFLGYIGAGGLLGIGRLIAGSRPAVRTA